MNKIIVLFAAIVLSGCASNSKPIYQNASNNLKDFEFRSPVVNEVVWQRIKISFEMNPEQLKSMSLKDLEQCILILELKQENSNLPPTKVELFATIELIDCMYMLGWRPTIAYTMIITH